MKQQKDMNLKYFLLSERRQCGKDTYCRTPTIQHSGKGKTVEIIRRSVVSQSPGRR